MIPTVEQTVTTSIFIAKTEDVDRVTRIVRSIANSFGFNRLDANLIASATSELAMNIVLHAGQGVAKIEPTDNGRGIEVSFVDEGPGIADMAQARIQGYSSRAGGLGLGLTAACRAVEHFNISSQATKGTTATIRHYVPPDTDWFDVGVVSISDDAYPCNGDLVYTCTKQGDKQLMAVIDGIGQGEHARQSAICARNALEASTSVNPCELVEQAHTAVSSQGLERGFTIALLLAARQRLHLVTVGDVACRVFNTIAGTEPYHFQDVPGTLGSSQKANIKEQLIDISANDSPLLIILASDGVSSNFTSMGEPIIGSSFDIANDLMRVFRQPSGDATIAALRINQ